MDLDERNVCFISVDFLLGLYFNLFIVSYLMYPNFQNHWLCIALKVQCSHNVLLTFPKSFISLVSKISNVYFNALVMSNDITQVDRILHINRHPSTRIHNTNNVECRLSRITKSHGRTRTVLNWTEPRRGPWFKKQYLWKFGLQTGPRVRLINNLQTHFAKKRINKWNFS